LSYPGYMLDAWLLNDNTVCFMCKITTVYCCSHLKRNVRAYTHWAKIHLMQSWCTLRKKWYTHWAKIHPMQCHKAFMGVTSFFLYVYSHCSVTLSLDQE